MTRTSTLSSPLLLGVERAVERVPKNSNGYPPYSIKRLPEATSGRSPSG